MFLVPNSFDGGLVGLPRGEYRPPPALLGPPALGLEVRARVEWLGVRVSGFTGPHEPKEKRLQPPILTEGPKLHLCLKIPFREQTGSV